MLFLLSIQVLRYLDLNYIYHSSDKHSEQQEIIAHAQVAESQSPHPQLVGKVPDDPVVEDQSTVERSAMHQSLSEVQCSSRIGGVGVSEGGQDVSPKQRGDLGPQVVGGEFTRGSVRVDAHAGGTGASAAAVVANGAQPTVAVTAATTETTAVLI